MRVRPAAVAGRFYPGRGEALERQVSTYLDAVPPEAPGPSEPPAALKALVVPHAGYVYSGQVAALAYRLLRGASVAPDRVLLLGPAHFVPVDGVALSGAAAWATPLGEAPIDVGGRADLLGRDATLPVVVDDAAHQPEHSLEVQVPFLQVLLPGRQVLPVLVGEGDPAAVAALLQPWWDDAGTLVVVSTDLSHYEPDAMARRHDTATAEAVLGCDPDAIGDRDACGARPLRVLLTWAKRPSTTVRLLGLATSADVGGDPARVVGYGAFAAERTW